MTLPSAAPEGEGIERNDILLFDPTGEAALLGEVSASGADGGDLRELLAAPDTRAGILAVLFGRDLPDVRIIAVDLEGLEPGTSRVRAGYVGSVPGFTRAIREGLEVPLGVRFDLVARYAPLERRSTDLELSAAGFPVHWRRDVQVGLSGNWDWTDIPPDVHETSAFGELSFSARVDQGMLHVAVELSIPLLRVPAADYPEFRAFLVRVDAVLEWTALATRPEPGE